MSTFTDEYRDMLDHHDRQRARSYALWAVLTNHRPLWEAQTQALTEVNSQREEADLPPLEPPL